MKINAKKTKVILINKARKWDFPTEVNFSEQKLVGVIVSSDIRWEMNVHMSESNGKDVDP